MTDAVLMVLVIGVVVLAAGIDVGALVAWLWGRR